jgi:hypothetical protein
VIKKKVAVVVFFSEADTAATPVDAALADDKINPGRCQSFQNLAQSFSRPSLS